MEIESFYFFLSIWMPIISSSYLTTLARISSACQKYQKDTNPLTDMSFANIFYHSKGCLLVLLIVSFAVQNLFISMKSQKFIFAFVSLAFGDISKKQLLWLMSKRLLLVFSSRIFMFSSFTFRSLIQIYFCVWCKKVIQFHSLTCTSQFSQYHLLK